MHNTIIPVANALGDRLNVLPVKKSGTFSLHCAAIRGANAPVVNLTILGIKQAICYNHVSALRLYVPCSSVVERPPSDRKVPGSSPGMAIFFVYTYGELGILKES